MTDLEDETISPPFIMFLCMFVGMFTVFVGVPAGLFWLAVKWWGES